MYRESIKKEIHQKGEKDSILPRGSTIRSDRSIDPVKRKRISKFEDDRSSLKNLAGGGGPVVVAGGEVVVVGGSSFFNPNLTLSLSLSQTQHLSNL